MSERHVFVADVHLRREELAKRRGFVTLLRELSKPDVHLYLLGDLFDLWVGPVQLEIEPELVPVFEALRRLVQAGGKLTFCHGNRDYCMRNHLTREIGAETVQYQKIIELDGRKTHLSHGDLLCTGDRLYHVARWFMRGPISMGLWRFFPVALKYGIAGGYRGISERQSPARRRKRHGISRRKVGQLMRRGVELIICGHVHEHMDRVCQHGGRRARLITLPPWQECGAALEYAAGKFTMRRVDFT